MGNLSFNKNMKKLIIIASIICCLLTALFQYRNFYKVNNLVFTVWKSNKGCYITPYCFLGFSIPQKDYIHLSNNGNILIYMNKDSSFLIFDDCMTDSIECSLKTYNFHLIRRNDQSLETLHQWEAQIDSCKNKGLSYINIDVRNMKVDTRE